jgi:hypothetical protein
VGRRLAHKGRCHYKVIGITSGMTSRFPPPYLTKRISIPSRQSSAKQCGDDDSIIARGPQLPYGNAP